MRRCVAGEIGRQLREMELTGGSRAHSSAREGERSAGWAGVPGWAGSALGFGPVRLGSLFFFCSFSFLFLFSVFRFSILNLIPFWIKSFL